MLIPSELELSTHGTVLQVDIGLVVTVLSGNSIQSFNLGINGLVLLELVIFLQPAGVLE